MSGKSARRSADATAIATRIAGLAAEKLFQSAAPLASSRHLTKQHLDMLQMSDIGVHTRLCLDEAKDAMRVGDYAHPSVIRCFEAYNQRCPKASNG